MYDYDVSVSSSSPNTPQTNQGFPSPFTRLSASAPASTGVDECPNPSSSLSPGVPQHHPGMSRLISGFPTPPVDGTPMSSAVLASYFNVDNQASPRRSVDESGRV